MGTIGYICTVRVHLIKKQTVENFISHHAIIRSAFEDWLGKLRMADWQKPKDIKSTFNSADMLGNGSNRVVFNIGGNNYRTICKYAFGKKEVHLFICWIGSHAEYDKICDKNEQYTINIY